MNFTSCSFLSSVWTWDLSGMRHSLRCASATALCMPSKQPFAWSPKHACYNFMHTQQTIFAWSPLCTYHSLMHASIQPFAQSSMCMLQPHIYPAYNILHSLQCVPATASSMPRIQTFTFPSLETLNSAHSEGLTNRLSKSWWRAFVLTHPTHIHLLPVGSETKLRPWIHVYLGQTSALLLRGTVCVTLWMGPKI